MATYSIKPLLLIIALAGAALPTQALAGPAGYQASAATNATAPVEMWDVIAPRAETKKIVSHIDVQPSQGFDMPGTFVPMRVQILTRADFTGAVAATEMWDAVPADNKRQDMGVSHMDIQPGQSFDYPATQAPAPLAIVRSASLALITTPDA